MKGMVIHKIKKKRPEKNKTTSIINPSNIKKILTIAPMDLENKLEIAASKYFQKLNPLP